MGKKINVTMEESKLKVGVDTNEDGQNAVEVKLNVKEGLEELFSKGEVKLEVKTLSLKLVGTKVVMTVDTDKDGESLLEVDADLLESYEEVSATFKK